MKKKNTRYALYGRVSSLSQKEDKTIKVQMDSLHNFVTANNLTVVDEYFDEAQSGMLPFDKRPEGRRLMNDAKAGKFDTVLFYRTDRLGRSPFDGLKTCQELSDLGISLHSITEYYDTSSQYGEMNFTILLLMAKGELDAIKQRMRDGKQRKLQNKEYIYGHLSYGWKLNENRQLILDESLLPNKNYSRIDVIKKIFEKCALENYGLIKLAKWLDLEDVPTPKGQPNWTIAIVRRILKDEKYTGIWRVNQTSKYYDEFCVSIPVVVSREIFELAQQNLKKRQTSHQRTGKRYLLNNGIMRCGYCGYAYSGYHDIASDTYAYRCGGKVSRAKYFNRKKCKKGSSISADIIESQIWNACVYILNNKDYFEDMLKTQLQEKQQEKLHDELNSNLILLNKQLKSLEDERKRIVDSLIKARISEAEFDILADKNKERTKIVKEQIARLSQKQENIIDINATLKKAEEYNAKFRAMLEQPITEAIKYEIIHGIIEKIILTTINRRDVEIAILWNYKKYLKFFQSKNDTTEQTSPAEKTRFFSVGTEITINECE